MEILEKAKKHIPYIKLNWNELIIQIGKDVLHPMEENHYITNIKIYDSEKNLIKNFELKPWKNPTAKISINELKNWKIIITATCNKHWTWENEFNL